MVKSPYPFSDRELLTRIGRSAGNKAGYKQLVRELGLGGGRERRLLVEQLTRMVGRGELRKLQDELWALPQPPATSESSAVRPATRSDSSGGRAAGPGQQSRESIRGGRDRLLSGRLELHRDGYGFVRLEARPSGKTGAASGSEPSSDLFIPPPALHGAMHGDLVLVEEDPPARDGRRSGRIARVLTRRNPTLVGIFHYGRPSGRRRGGQTDRDPERFPELSGNFVQPLDERLGGPVEISHGDETPQIGASGVHRTLGDEARRRSTASPEQQTSSTAASADEIADDEQDRGNPQDATANRWPLEGLAVEVEITSFPQPGRPARGRVVEVLGPPDAFGVDVEIVIRKHAIPHTFPAHVLAEAEERARVRVDELSAEELAFREDFRGLPTITIDGETARDFDDAVLVRPLINGNTELQVHIADVGWYVDAGSALDTEARVRGTSVYFPDRAVPMLPHALSSGMCSLLPQEDRLVLSCVMEIDALGEVVGYRVGEGLLRSIRRMTYTGVQACLNASPQAETWNAGRGSVEKDTQAAAGETQMPLGTHSKASKGVITPDASAEDRLERERVGLNQPELPGSLDRMLDLALRLNRKRARRGSIDFDLPEPVVAFDPDGNMKAIVRSERGWAHRLIEEFMLSANECVATWLTAQGIPSLYRIHEMPDPKRVMEFEDTAAGFGQTLGIGALPVKRLTMKSDRREVQRRSSQGRNGRQAPVHVLPERIPVTPQMYQRLVKRIHGTPEERILAYLMLRSLKQARYAEKNEGHFALASPCYTHFTSPIRRYPDLIVHRLLRAMLRRGADPRGGPVLSGDPQPWAVELARAGGRHATMPPQAFRVREMSPQAQVRTPAVADPLPLSVGKLGRRKRPGRIGWSAGEDGAGARRSPGALSTEADLGEEVGEAPVELGDAQEDTQSSTDFVTERNGVGKTSAEPISAEELADIATESSQAERRAADAERELIEWKKMKFMADQVGNDFRAIVLSVTKYGFFVELDELFIEGLVPLGSLTDDFYTFRDTDRSICGARNGHCFRVGDRVEVVLDRIDRQQRRLQFALLPGTEPGRNGVGGSLRAGKSEAKKARAEARRQEKSVAKIASPAKGKAKKKKRRNG